MQAALLRWGEGSRRDLPWRRTRDPWAVLVSEVMLQQTQVPRVVPIYKEFMRRFPTAAACASVPVGDVVRVWSGLGYNRRAVNLHRAATAIVAWHESHVPEGLAELRSLPGVGAYTARAVRVFAFGYEEGLVDTNAGRFLARAAAGRPLSTTEAQTVADGLVPSGRAWEWGQAVFDLGALVCTRRNPRCDICPVQEWCSWSRAGCVAPDPLHGSAGVSARQSPFVGSDRQGRGRLVAALRRHRVPWAELAATAGWPGDGARAERVAAQLVVEGIAESDGEFLRLS
jgi:A/G-specific adenine glycosylase